MAHEQRRLTDDRSRSRGWPWIFIVLLCFAAVVFAWRAIIAITTQVHLGHYAIAATSCVVALAWIGGCMGTLHNGRRMRICAFACWVANLLLAILGLAIPQVFDPSNPAYVAGKSYVFLPTCAIVLVLIWHIWSQPAAMAARQSEESQRRR
ncbi:hypothetical protein [Trueperella sp. LYQ143]|uniref:hypothetical protein n=1 Tax=Trueperella sp. LYQ143 TaxID=3391059 RepID=UPI003982F6F9